MSWWTDLRKNIVPVALAPVTGGTSLLLAEDSDGYKMYQHITGEAQADKANKQNIALQQQTNEASIELANTAHQREVQDLIKAGLNPILSAGGNGATTPTLGTAHVENTMPGGYAQTASNLANTFTSVAGGIQGIANANLANEQAANTRAQTAYVPTEKRAQIANTNANTQLATAKTMETQAQTENLKQQWNLLNNEQKKQMLELQQLYETAPNEAKRAELEKKFYNTWFGRQMKYIGLTLGNIGEVLGPTTNALKKPSGGITINN